MSIEDLKKIFAEALDIPESEVYEDLKYNTISQWDSIAHMALIAALDKEFNITMETDDIIDLSSFSKAKEILTKYGVEVC